MAHNSIGHEQERTVSLHGVSFRVQQRGSRPDVVFLHGFGGDLQTWDPLWRRLDASRPMLRYDLRGYGRTVDPGIDGFSHTDDLIALLDVLGEEQYDLVGVSMGGSIALHAALEQAARVRKLVLLSPSLVGWDWSPEWRAQWQEIVTAARQGNLERARRLWWLHPLFASTRASGAAELLHQSIMSFSGDQWLEERARPELPDIERLHELTPKTLVLSGALDVPDFHLIARLIAAASERAQCIDLPEAGHMLHWEAPERCAELIEVFLSEES